MAFHPGENTLDGSLLEDSYRTYIRKNIKEIFGLSITEYMDLTRDHIYLLNKIADEEAARNAPVVESLTRDLKSMKK